MYLITLCLFSLGGIAVVYLLNYAIARRYIVVHPKSAITYILTMASLGVLGEIIFDTTYRFVFGQALWMYRIFPIHNAYTSIYSLILWGCVGFHLYLFHDTLERRGITSLHTRAWLFCLEAIIFEALANLSSLAVFGRYLFYYFPDNLWHITALQAIPLYLLAGYGTMIAIDFARKLPKLALVGNTTVLTLLLCIK